MPWSTLVEDSPVYNNRYMNKCIYFVDAHCTCIYGLLLYTLLLFSEDETVSVLNMYMYIIIIYNNNNKHLRTVSILVYILTYYTSVVRHPPGPHRDFAKLVPTMSIKQINKHVEENKGKSTRNHLRVIMLWCMRTQEPKCYENPFSYLEQKFN